MLLFTAQKLLPVVAVLQKNNADLLLVKDEGAHIIDMERLYVIDFPCPTPHRKQMEKEMAEDQTTARFSMTHKRDKLMKFIKKSLHPLSFEINLSQSNG